MTTDPANQNPDQPGPGGVPQQPPSPPQDAYAPPPGAYPPPPGGYAPPPGAYAPPPGGYAPPPGNYPPPPGGYGPPPAYGAPAPAPPLSDADQRLWATLAHLSGLLFSFVAPLVIWLVFKQRGAYVEDQSKEALNFQITLAILAAAISIISVITLGIGAILYLVFIPAVVFMIVAGIAANRGEPYRYPASIRLVK